MSNLKDYDDNGEVGAGAKILGTMERKNATQAAVYMVRYHGQNLGMRRFEIFNDQTEKVLDKLDDPDAFTTSTLPKPKYRVTTPRARGRGRRPARGTNIGTRGSRGHTSIGTPLSYARVLSPK